jgi:hypothetical protein
VGAEGNLAAERPVYDGQKEGRKVREEGRKEEEKEGATCMVSAR